MLSPAPLAEGVITAVVTAATGASRQGNPPGARPFADRQAVPAGTYPPGPLLKPASLYRMRPPISAIPARLPWKTPLDFTPGLQPGWPTIAGKYEADIQLRNLTRETDFVPARSINALIGLQAVRQHTLELRAAGNQAAEAFSELAGLLQRHFDESTDPPGRTPDNPKETPNPHRINGISVGQVWL